MQFKTVLPVLAAAAVSAQNSTLPVGNYTIVTEVVPSFVTVCPGPTVFTYAQQTYTVTAPTTLTITDCPCTRTKVCFAHANPSIDACSHTDMLQTVPCTDAPTPMAPMPTAGTGSPPKPVPTSYVAVGAAPGAGFDDLRVMATGLLLTVAAAFTF